MFETALTVRESITRLTRAVNFRVGLINEVIDCLKYGQPLDDEVQGALIQKAARPESLGFCARDFEAAAEYCTKGAEYYSRQIPAVTEDAIMAARNLGRVKARLISGGAIAQADQSKLKLALTDAKRAHSEVESVKLFAARFERAVSLFQAAAACVA